MKLLVGALLLSSVVGCATPRGPVYTTKHRNSSVPDVETNDGYSGEAPVHRHALDEIEDAPLWVERGLSSGDADE